MFALMAFLKVLGVVVALLLIGMMLMPTHVLLLVVGALAGLVGVVLLFISPVVGTILIPTGAVLVVGGIAVRRRLEGESNRAAEAAKETARRTSRAMDAYIPSDD
jgi:membrane protein implicated in regulation of membrane protease activity